MRVHHYSLCLAVVFGWLLALPQNRKAESIPNGFDFPANQTTLLNLRDANDVAGMRLHTWSVFAGMTEPTSTGEAIWETWYSVDETFGAAQPQALEMRKLQRSFRVPRQFQKTGLQPQAAGTSLASFTLFSGDLRGFVRKEKLHQKSTLKKINDSFDSHTPIEKRAIPDFPNSAVALKTVWWIVKRSGLTAMPVWDPDLNPPIETGNDIGTWMRCVAVDPSRPSVPADETTQLQCNQKPATTTRVVPLESFYHFALTEDQLKQMKAQQPNIPNLQDAMAGDFVALVALHYTTKEIPDWVWATFWWHDKPNDGRFAANRPDQVKGVWRNYLMAESYSMDTPAEQGSGAHVAFNPWLEARFRSGVTSNCMTCHRRAVFSGKSSDSAFLPVTHGTPAKNDARFKDSTKVDFLWSVFFESH